MCDIGCYVCLWCHLCLSCVGVCVMFVCTIRCYLFCVVLCVCLNVSCLFDLCCVMFYGWL